MCPISPLKLGWKNDTELPLSRFWQGWDITFNYLYQYNNLQVLRQKLSVVGANPVVTIRPEYERTHVIGTTFSNAFSDWMVRGEIGYFTEHYFIANTSNGDGIVRPKISYEWQDNIETWLAADIFYGDKQGIFGQFDRNDRIVLGMEVSF